MLSPIGPALQFGGGSRLRDCNSLFRRLRAIYKTISLSISPVAIRARTLSNHTNHTFYSYIESGIDPTGINTTPLPLKWIENRGIVFLSV